MGAKPSPETQVCTEGPCALSLDFDMDYFIIDGQLQSEELYYTVCYNPHCRNPPIYKDLIHVVKIISISEEPPEWLIKSAAGHRVLSPLVIFSVYSLSLV